jgi:hypothetical protein
VLDGCIHWTYPISYRVMNDCFFLVYSDGSAGCESSFSSSMASDLLKSPFGPSVFGSIVSLNSLGRLLSTGLPRCLNCTPLGFAIFKQGPSRQAPEELSCRARLIAQKGAGHEMLELLWAYCEWHVKKPVHQSARNWKARLT